MAKHSPIATAPRYMATFACAGSACEDTCCQGWHISIDKQTFKKYREIRIPVLGEKLRTHIVRTDGSNDPNEYASIRLGQDGHCPLLSADRLCEIHATLGAAHLSDTCATYPRIYLRRNGRFEQYAEVSCPAAARAALLDPAAQEPAEMPLPYPNAAAVPPHRTIVTGEAGASLLMQLYDQIAATADHIVRAPQLRAGEALIVLSLLVRRVARLFDGADIGDVRPEVARSLLAFFEPEQLLQARTLARELAPDRPLQLQLLTEVTRLYAGGRQSYRDMSEETLRGFGFDPQDAEGSAARFAQAERDWFAPFDDAHPHILKNLLLNDLGKNLFPLGKGRGLETEFLDLALRFGLIRLHLVGMAAVKRAAFGADDYIHVIYHFSRNVEHNRPFLMRIHALLAENGLAKTATAALLVR